MLTPIERHFNGYLYHFSAVEMIKKLNEKEIDLKKIYKG